MRKALSVLSFSLIFCAVAAAQTAPPESAFRVYERHYEPGMRITPYLQYQIDVAWRQDDMRRARLEAITSEADLLAYQREIRAKMLENLGGLPEEKTPLNPQITGAIQQEGYRIEKVLFESLPGYHVSANLYVPDGLKGKAPAVLVVLGHSNIGKAYPVYQKICGRLARRGYVVLTWDPAGQGERSQFWDESKGDSRYNRVCGEHTILGDLAYVAGANLGRWWVWDGIRAHDYLLSRPEVDPERISITGNSGGGYQAEIIGALDTRNRVVIPSCYTCSMPMRIANRMFADPDGDPEQDIYRMITDGVDQTGMLTLVWPRPLGICAAVLDFFPIEGVRMVFRQVEPLWRLFGDPAKLMLTEGYHGHGYSEYNQENAFAFLDRYNGLTPRYSLDSIQTLPEKDLWVTKSGQVRLDHPEGKSFLDLVAEYSRARGASLHLDLADLYREGCYPGVDTWTVVEDKGGRPSREVEWKKAGSVVSGPLRVEKYVLTHSAALTIPVLRFTKGVGGGKTLFWFTLDGKAKAADWPAVQKYLDQGYDVLSFDFRALGENRLNYLVMSIDDPRLAQMTADEQYYSPLSGVLGDYVYNSLLVGRPYFLQMIEDVEIVQRFARSALGVKDVQVTGAGLAATLAKSAAEVLPGVSYLAAPDAQEVSWAGLVEKQVEQWPVHYLLPYGAFVH